MNGTSGRFGRQRWVWGLGQGRKGRGRGEAGEVYLKVGQEWVKGYVLGTGVDGVGTTAAGAYDKGRTWRRVLLQLRVTELITKLGGMAVFTAVVGLGVSRS